MKTKPCNVIDLTKAPYTEYGAGPKRGNPRKCLRCGQQIRKGEAWTKNVSAADPEYGRYATIHHSPICPNQKAYNRFQRMLAGGKRDSG